MTSVRRSALFLCLALASCAPRQPGVALDTGSVPSDRLARLVAERSERVRTLTGRGALAIDAPEFAGTARFELALCRADSALIRIEGPFGLDLATVFITRRGFIAYTSMNNTVTTGSMDGRGLEAAFPVKVPMDRLLEALSGAIPLPTEPPARYVIENDRFLLVYRTPAGTTSYRVDPAELLVTGFTAADTTGAVVLEMTSSKLDAYDGFTLPRRVEVHMPEKETDVVVSFTSLHPNDPAPSFAYSIPRNARRVER
jgi:hypothetical protein